MSNYILTKNSDVKEIRLITDNGNEVLALSDALKIATEQELDLVVISDGLIPVCKLLNHSNFMYEKRKKEKLNQKLQKSLALKEVQLSLYIEKHDMQIKASQTMKHLSKGHKVRINITLKGADRRNISASEKVINEFLELIGKDNYTVDSTNKQDNFLMGITISK